MVFIKIPMHKRNVEARLRAVADWKIPEEEKGNINRFINDLALGKVNRGYKIGEARQLKYLDTLKIAFTFLNRPSSKVTAKDIERLDIALSKNTLLRTDGKPYAEETKVEIKRFLKVFLKWRFKTSPTRVFDLTSWIDTKIRKKKTPDFLTEAEVCQLYDACRDAQGRFIVTVLFDSGARAEEFFNIRFEDIEKPDGNRNFYRLHLKEEYSKTKGRVVPLVWDKSTAAIGKYLSHRIALGIKPGDRVYPGTYDAMRFFLKRLGARILNKRVYPHLLRHSSATYYASKLNRQQLCKRYGWAFSSDMPDVYINRAGVDESEVEDKFTRTELGVLKVQLEDHQRRGKLQTETLKETEQRLVALEHQLKESQIISAMLHADPAFRSEFETAIKRRLAKPRIEFNRKQRTPAMPPEVAP